MHFCAVSVVEGGGDDAKVGTGEGWCCCPRREHRGGQNRGLDVWLVSSGCLHVVHHSVLQIKGGCHLGLDFSLCRSLFWEENSQYYTCIGQNTEQFAFHQDHVSAFIVCAKELNI